MPVLTAGDTMNLSALILLFLCLPNEKVTKGKDEENNFKMRIEAGVKSCRTLTFAVTDRSDF
jgi:hypothetical protein